MSWSIGSLGPADWWSCPSGGWATWIVLSLLLSLYGLRLAVRARKKPRAIPRSSENSASLVNDIPTVTEGDLKRLLLLLDEIGDLDPPWIPVVEERNESLAYYAKQRDAKDGHPTEYLSTSVFEDCTTEKLRDFYMDSEYRMKWDVTFESHEQLAIIEESGLEIGRIVRIFPLMRPREYVLSWKLWKGEDESYYYFAKNCTHPLAPECASYTRVGCYLSGWRIRKVSGRDACEIKMWHQEDTSLMAKMAFTYRIWNYMCIMERALRKYKKGHLKGTKDAVSLSQKVPPGLLESIPSVPGNEPKICWKATCIRKKRKISFTKTGKMIANGMLVLGGAVFCARGAAPLGAKIAAVYAIRKMMSPQTSRRRMEQH